MDNKMKPKSRHRNRVRPMTNKQSVLNSFRGCGEADPVKLCKSAAELLKEIVNR